MAIRLELLAQLAEADQLAKQVLADLRAETIELIATVRRLAHARTIDSPVENVEAALLTIVSRLNQAVSPKLTFTLDYDPAIGRLPIRIKSAAFWIAREAIINVVKHSQARHCAVSLQVSSGELRLRVEDDGCAKRSSPTHGSGLRNMIERAAQFGGRCQGSPIDPTGYAVVAGIPLEPERTGGEP